MPKCLLCRQTELIEESDALRCPDCLITMTADARMSLQDKPEILDDLRRFARWNIALWKKDRKGPHGPTFLNDEAIARAFIEDLKSFQCHKEKCEAIAVDELIAAGSVENPWAEPVKRVGDALGLLCGNEERDFVKDLETRKIVQISRPVTRRPLAGGQPLPALRYWERCEPI